jgi:hypothetical protein
LHGKFLSYDTDASSETVITTHPEKNCRYILHAAFDVKPEGGLMVITHQNHGDIKRLTNLSTGDKALDLYHQERETINRNGLGYSSPHPYICY